MEGTQLSFLYLAILLFSITGLGLIDYKYKLCLAESRKNIWLVIVPVVFFLIWDLAGIALGIFFRGSAEHLTGIVLSNELPIEEVFFLIVLSYSTLVLYKAFARRSEKSSSK